MSYKCDEVIIIKLTKEDKKLFFSKCKENETIPSIELRSYIQKYNRRRKKKINS